MTEKRLVTAAQLVSLFVLAPSVASSYEAPLDAALREFEITTPFRIAAFLAQVGHESVCLKTWREIWGPTPDQLRYEPPSALAAELGNTSKGDGLKYRGHGPIQITGKANHKRCGEALGLDLVAHPELLERPEHGFRSSGWFWKTRELNQFADRDSFDGFRFITRRINGRATIGPPSHHERRIVIWLAARTLFGLQGPLEAPRVAA